MRPGKCGREGTALLSSETMALARNAEYVGLEGKLLHRVIEGGQSEPSTKLIMNRREGKASGNLKPKVTLQISSILKGLQNHRG